MMPPILPVPQMARDEVKTVEQAVGELKALLQRAAAERKEMEATAEERERMLAEARKDLADAEQEVGNVLKC